MDATRKVLLNEQSNIIENYKRSGNAGLCCEARKCQYLIKLSNPRARAALMQIMPFVKDITPEGHIILNESNLGALSIVSSTLQKIRNLAPVPSVPLVEQKLRVVSTDPRLAEKTRVISTPVIVPEKVRTDPRVIEKRAIVAEPVPVEVTENKETFNTEEESDFFNEEMLQRQVTKPETQPGSFVSVLGFMFKAPLLLALFDFSNPLLIAFSAIITVYCIIGFLVMLPLSWMGYNVNKYFLPFSIFKNFTNQKSIKN